MEMSEQPTCGKGLAENSVLPARLGELIEAMAQNLQAHMKALDLNDPPSRAEHDAYKGLVEELQQAATQLKATARQMVGYRDLPMGRHDEQEMKHQRVLAAFETFVKHKRELLSLLEQTTKRDESLLEVIRVNSSSD